MTSSFIEGSSEQTQSVRAYNARHACVCMRACVTCTHPDNDGESDVNQNTERLAQSTEKAEGGQLCPVGRLHICETFIFNALKFGQQNKMSTNYISSRQT